MTTDHMFIEMLATACTSLQHQLFGLATAMSLFVHDRLLTQLFEISIATALMFPLKRLLTWNCIKPLLRTLPDSLQEKIAYCNQHSCKTAFFIKLSLEESFDFGCIILSTMVLHLIGGSLCLPSVFQMSCISPATASTMACHGAIFEASWELHDILKRIYEVFILKNQKAHHKVEALASKRVSMKGHSSYLAAHHLGNCFPSNTFQIMNVKRSFSPFPPPNHLSNISFSSLVITDRLSSRQKKV